MKLAPLCLLHFTYGMDYTREGVFRLGGWVGGIFFGMLGQLLPAHHATHRA